MSKAGKDTSMLP